MSPVFRGFRFFARAWRSSDAGKLSENQQYPGQCKLQNIEQGGALKIKRFYLLMAVVVGLVCFGYGVTAHAAAYEPVVAEFEANQAVKLEVGTADGESSWMSLIFETPIDPSEYPYLYVSFDIYRSSASGSNNEFLP